MVTYISRDQFEQYWDECLRNTEDREIQDYLACSPDENNRYCPGARVITWLEFHHLDLSSTTTLKTIHLKNIIQAIRFVKSQFSDEVMTCLLEILLSPAINIPARKAISDLPTMILGCGSMLVESRHVWNTFVSQLNPEHRTNLTFKPEVHDFLCWLIVEFQRTIYYLNESSFRPVVYLHDFMWAMANNLCHYVDSFHFRKLLQLVVEEWRLPDHCHPVQWGLKAVDKIFLLYLPVLQELREEFETMCAGAYDLLEPRIAFLVQEAFMHWLRKERLVENSLKLPSEPEKQEWQRECQLLTSRKKSSSSMFKMENKQKRRGNALHFEEFHDLLQKRHRRARMKRFVKEVYDSTLGFLAVCKYPPRRVASVLQTSVSYIMNMPYDADVCSSESSPVMNGLKKFSTDVHEAIQQWLVFVETWNTAIKLRLLKVDIPDSVQAMECLERCKIIIPCQSRANKERQQKNYEKIDAITSKVLETSQLMPFLWILFQAYPTEEVQQLYLLPNIQAWNSQWKSAHEALEVIAKKVHIVVTTGEVRPVISSSNDPGDESKSSISLIVNEYKKKENGKQQKEPMRRRYRFNRD